MKKILAILLIITVCSCKQKVDGTNISQVNTSEDSIIVSQIPNTNSWKTNKITDQDLLNWEKQQDSIRSEILKSKTNKVLKESFLQEFYIRNVARVSNDSLFVTIPFDLHGPDCGAPDCYSTDISFSFPIGEKLIFPKRLTIREHEHGCVEKETQLTGTFQLTEQTNRHIIYHSDKPRRTLVLFNKDKENQAKAYYFTGLAKHIINGKNVYTITHDYNENDPNSIYPFTSWVLSTNEYEHFLN